MQQERAIAFSFYDLFSELRDLILITHASPLSNALISMTCKQAHAERRKPYKHYVSDTAIVRYLTQMFVEGDPHLLRWMLDEQLDKKPDGGQHDPSVPSSGLSFYLPTRYVLENGIGWTFARLAQISLPSAYQQVGDWFGILGMQMTWPANSHYLLTQLIFGDNFPMMEHYFPTLELEEISISNLDLLTRYGSLRTRRFFVDRWLSRSDVITPAIFYSNKFSALVKLAASLRSKEVLTRITFLGGSIFHNEEAIQRATMHSLGAEGSDEEIENAISKYDTRMEGILFGAISSGRTDLATNLWRRIIERNGAVNIHKTFETALEDRRRGCTMMLVFGGLETFQRIRVYDQSRFLTANKLRELTGKLYAAALSMGDTSLLDYLHDVENLALDERFLTDVKFIPTNLDSLGWLKARLPDMTSKIQFLSTYYLRIGRPDIAAWFDGNYISLQLSGVEKWLRKAHFDLTLGNRTADAASGDLSSDLKCLPMTAGYYITQ